MDQRPSMKQIILTIDQILTELMIPDVTARKFWQDQFLFPRNELQETIPWNEFVQRLQVTLIQGQSNVPTFHKDTFRKLKELLAEKSMDESKHVVTMRCDLIVC